MTEGREPAAPAIGRKDITRVQELVYEMKVGQVMIRDVVTVRSDSMMKDLRALLRDRRISGVPVVDEGRLAGMVSLEDFITCLAEGRMNSSVKERMTDEVMTLYDTDPLVKAVELFDRFESIVNTFADFAFFLNIYRMGGYFEGDEPYLITDF